jgi:signal transduction histidine kinase
MRLLPRSLFGQVLLALVLGLAAAQAVGFWLMFDERSRLAGRLLGGFAAQRIAGFVSLLDGADQRERARLVRALSVPPTRISMSESWRTLAQPVSEDAQWFGQLLLRELGQSRQLQVVSIVRSRLNREREDDAKRWFEPAAPAEQSAAPSEARGELDRESWRGPGKRGMRRPFNLVIVQIKLADGAVATFRHALPVPPQDQPLRLAALVAVSGLTVALLAGWAVRRLTRPLATLADAASGLAQDLNQAPLPETGPTEVARAARAFNSMQTSLRTYVNTRAQALAGVSHDLRLPLTRVRLRIERIADAETKQNIEADLDEMERMIGATLEYLRAGASSEDPVRLNLNALIEGVAEDMEALGATVRIDGRSDAAITARPQALRRCLANLMDNARRYGRGDIDIRVIDAEQLVEIRIEDRGPGIPAAARERVFEPYVRLEQSRARHTGGTGLGLAIARAIARAHGGEVTLAAREGGGLSARLTLPRTQPER